MWIANGGHWFYGNAPEHWNPWMQLIRAGLDVPRPFTAFRFDSSAVVEGTKIKLLGQEFELCPAA